MRSIQFKNLILIIILFLPVVGSGQGYRTCWLILTDKDGVTFDPYTYFDSKAIDRRNKGNIPLADYTDFPVRQDYLDQIASITDSIVYVSRWLNAIIIKEAIQDLGKYSDLPFVQEIWYDGDDGPGHIAEFNIKKDDAEEGFKIDETKSIYLKAQVERMKGSSFKIAGIDGTGVRVAIFDIGFKSYKTNPAFEHIRQHNKIIKTWDFAHNKEDVDGHHSHGCQVLSCIAGLVPESDHQIGLATGSEFLLAITEKRTENFKEEVNWLAAAEWADKNGADIINSSLGYTYHRYFRYNMDGKTSFVSRAALIASNKGILVVNSAGNDGSNPLWMNIGAPADVEEVLSVGGISPSTGYHVDFSSFGPTWDRRMKPNVTAYGEVIGSGPRGYSETQGTSFSSPLVAGFAACVLQLHPEWKRQDLFEAIQRSADIYPYFDYAHGYGVPQADFFTDTVIGINSNAGLNVTDHGKYYLIEIDSNFKQVNNGNILSHNKERYFISEPGFIYYHIENEKGYLDRYAVIDPLERGIKSHYWMGFGESDEELRIYKSDYSKPFILRVYYKGQLIDFQCNDQK